MRRKKNFLLFVWVCGTTAVLMLVGWSIGALFSHLNGVLGAIIGVGVGGIIGAEIADRRGYYEADWNILISRSPLIGMGILFAIGGILKAPNYILAVLAVLGAGFGALTAKYMLRFFIHEPPPSILK